MTRTLVTLDSRNAKTGRVALATYRSQSSCPLTCPLMGSGCYAENRGQGGRPSPFGMVDASTSQRLIIGTDYSTLTAELARIRAHSVVRFNVSGDYLDDTGQPDRAYIDATNHAARYGHVVLSYTHAWRILEPSWFEDGARPQASCDGPVDVTDALAAGWAPVMVDPDGRYPQGRRINDAVCVTCPYSTRGRQCVDCRLCGRSARRSVVIFPAHGARKSRIAEVLS